MSMSGSGILTLDLLGNSDAMIGGGSVSSGISIWESGRLAVHGGDIGSFIQLADSGLAELWGGSIDGWVYAEDLSVIDVYGYDFAYAPTAGSRNGGQLTGRWAYGGTFALDFVDNIESGVTYYGHVVLHEFIPEPCTLVLLGMGGLLIGKRK